jgi:hypothetical protein
MSMDALHVIAGVVLLFAVAFVCRTSVTRRLPILVVLFAAILNEASDFRAEIWPEFAMQAGESAKDLVLTLAVPALIFLVARYRPKLFAYRSS